MFQSRYLRVVILAAGVVMVLLAAYAGLDKVVFKTEARGFLGLEGTPVDRFQLLTFYGFVGAGLLLAAWYWGLVEGWLRVTLQTLARLLSENLFFMVVLLGFACYLMVAAYLMVYYHPDWPILQGDSVWYNNEMYHAINGKLSYNSYLSQHVAYSHGIGEKVLTTLVNHTSYLHMLLVAPLYALHPSIVTLKMIYLAYTVILGGFFMKLLLNHGCEKGSVFCILAAVTVFALNPFNIVTGYGIYLGQGYPGYLAYPLGFLYFYALLSEKRWLIYLAAVLLILVKEHMFLVPLAGAIYMFFFLNRRDAIIIAALAVAAAVFNILIFPRLIGASSHVLVMVGSQSVLESFIEKISIYPARFMFLFSFGLVGLWLAVTDQDRRRMTLALCLLVIYAFFSAAFINLSFCGHNSAIPLVIIITLIVMYSASLPDYLYKRPPLVRRVANGLALLFIVSFLATSPLARLSEFARAYEVPLPEQRAVLSEIVAIQSSIPKHKTVGGMIYDSKWGLVGDRVYYQHYLPPYPENMDFLVLPRTNAPVLEKALWWKHRFAGVAAKEGMTLHQYVAEINQDLKDSGKWQVRQKTNNFQVWEPVGSD